MIQEMMHPNTDGIIRIDKFFEEQIEMSLSVLIWSTNNHFQTMGVSLRNASILRNNQDGIGCLKSQLWYRWDGIVLDRKWPHVGEYPHTPFNLRILLTILVIIPLKILLFPSIISIALKIYHGHRIVSIPSIPSLSILSFLSFIVVERSLSSDFSLWRCYFWIQPGDFSPVTVEKFPFIFQSFIDNNPIQLHSNWVSELAQFNSLVFIVFPASSGRVISDLLIFPR
jgi:hypothetical protein